MEKQALEAFSEFGVLLHFSMLNLGVQSERMSEDSSELPDTTFIISFITIGTHVLFNV